jgi:adenosylmethionine-8-amino-7-oxononanoate aminotransferase
MASLWYCSIGHGRTEVADAVSAQMRTLAAYQCFDRFTNDPADQLAERISRLAAPAMGDGNRVFFASGGSEAVDSAIKIVRAAQAQRGYQERTIVISRAPSYHGVTYGGMTLTGLPLNRACFGPGVGDVVQVPKTI